MASSIQGNLTSLLQMQAQRVGNKPAIYEPQIKSQGVMTHGHISFQDLEQRSAQLAAELSRQGLTRGDRMLVMVPMSIDLYIILIALFRIGGVAVFIDPWVGRKRLSQFAHQVQPFGMFGIPKAQVMRWIPGLLPRLKLNVVVGSKLLAPLSKSLDQIRKSGTQQADILAVAPEDPALITFTTGSTGTPKGVVRTHGFLVAQHEVLTQHLGLMAEDIDLPLLPVFVLNNLANGISSVLPAMDTREVSKSDPAQLLQQIQSLKVTTTVGSPVIYERLAAYCEKSGDQLGQLRTLHTGGAPVSRELILELQGLMPAGEAHIVYGSTEAEPISSIAAHELDQEDTSTSLGECVGYPDPATQVLIIKASPEPLTTLEPLAQGEVGEIVVTGDHVNKDYYENPEAVRKTKIKLDKGEIWHRTGDVGRMGPEGRLYLLGRVDQVIELDGKQIYPLEVEPLINTIQGVQRSAFFQGVDGKIYLACTCTVDVTPALVAEIRSRLRGISETDVDVLQVKEIPMDPRHNSKIDYLKLEQDLTELTLKRFDLS